MQREALEKKIHNLMGQVKTTKAGSLTTIDDIDCCARIFDVMRKVFFEADLEEWASTLVSRDSGPDGVEVALPMGEAACTQQPPVRLIWNSGNTERALSPLTPPPPGSRPFRISKI
jgi:hypothetical protein